jgi:hypothetical protein
MKGNETAAEADIYNNTFAKNGHEVGRLTTG